MSLKIFFYPYKLPLRENWPDQRNSPVSFREGWIIRLDENGRSGIGDCAPFPAFGTESRENAMRLLQFCAEKSWADSTELLGELEYQRPTCPSACFALETAALDLESRKENLPLRKLLDENASEQVRTNAFCGSICRKIIENTTETCCQTIKLKAGNLNIEQEISCLKELCKKLPPQTRVRLDANGAWQPDEARAFLNAAEGLPIESLEEPLLDPDLESLALLQSETSVTLALDESLMKLNLDAVLSNTRIRRLVLKPALHGGLRYTCDLARKAVAAGKETVITTLIDSAVGVHASCQLASAVDAFSPELAHGLATSGWLVEDVAAPPEIRAGYVLLSAAPGLGIDETFQI